uniref:KH_dom_type_1 domain-containing protein n=1 Tax=Mesocestoides corti TaxID=53468 RepID=A0A5K3F0D2_MESCO
MAGDKGNQNESDLPSQQKPSGYRIVGTVSQPGAEIPKFVETILNYEDRRDFYEHIFECDCIIYDITSDQSQLDEALWVASSIAQDYARIPTKKVFLLITHLLSWLDSKTDSQGDQHSSLSESDHAKRKPHPHYIQHYSTEKTILNLG